MCGCTLGLYYSKINISSLKRFTKPQMQIKNVSLLKPHQFLLSLSPFQRKKVSNCVAILTQNTHVYDCGLVLYPFQFNISSYARFVKPVMGIIDEFILELHHFLSSKSQMLRKIEQLRGSFVPKMHVRMVLDRWYIVLRSVLVHMKGSGSLEWESGLGFYSNLTSFYQTNPQFEGKLSTFVAILTRNTYLYSYRVVLHHLKSIINNIQTS